MNKLDKLCIRYLNDSIPNRLGGLAANLGHITSFSKNDNHFQVVESILQESKWFIEWTSSDLAIEALAELVQLQILLAQWEIQSPKKWNDPNWRIELANQSREWSQRVLQMSGLLNL